MADYSEIGYVSSPVTVDDVGDYLGETSKVVKDLCESDNINMWSKNKPMHYCAAGVPPIALLTEEQKKAAHYGISLENPTWGIDNYISSVDAGTAESRWQYRTFDSSADQETTFVGRPHGGACSPFRLHDFRGYLRSAEPTFGVLTENQLVTVDTMGETKTVRFSCFLQTGDEIDDYSINPADIIPTDGNYYYTIRVVKPDGTTYGTYSCDTPCVTSGGSFDPTATSVDATIVSASGTFTIYHMLMLEGGNAFLPFPNYNKTTLSFQSKPVTVISKAGMAYADIVTQWKTVNALKYYDMEDQINLYGKSSIVIYAKVVAQKDVTNFKPTNLRLQADSNTLPYSDVIIFNADGTTLDSINIVSGTEYTFYFAFQGAITNYGIANECDMEIALSDDKNAIGYISTEQIHFTPSSGVSIEGTEISRT